MELSTTYLGLPLAHPLMPGASPMVDDLDRVRRLEDAGASAIAIKVGDKSPLTVMTFSAGASSIKVGVPKESGCQIRSETFMVSKEFDGFTKTENGVYQTPNFSTSKNKVMLIVKTAVSKIEITRY